MDSDILVIEKIDPVGNIWSDSVANDDSLAQIVLHRLLSPTYIVNNYTVPGYSEFLQRLWSSSVELTESILVNMLIYYISLIVFELRDMGYNVTGFCFSLIQFHVTNNNKLVIYIKFQRTGTNWYVIFKITIPLTRPSGEIPDEQQPEQPVSIYCP